MSMCVCVETFGRHLRKGLKGLIFREKEKIKVGRVVLEFEQGSLPCSWITFSRVYEI